MDDRRTYAAMYAALIGALLVVGVAGAVFNDRVEDVVASVPSSTAVSSTTTPNTTSPNDSAATTVAPTTSSSTTTSTTTTTTTTVPTTTTTTTTIPLADRTLARIDSVSGNIAPKSVVATPNGLFFAQNMMYRHSVTVYDEYGSLLKTISDRVDLAEYGIEDGVVARGAPVEAASTSDGSKVYVSNYAMYGPGFGREPGDSCGDTGWDNSFLYRVDTGTLDIDQVIEVGAVPKFLGVSPDDRWVLVSNWCSFDLSIVDTELGVEIGRIDIGRHPRGIAISSDSSTAYVTEMGGSDIAIIPLDQIERRLTGPGGQTIRWNIDELDVRWLRDVGSAPRSVVLSPDDQTLYATLNGEGRVIKIDLASGEVVERVRTGDAPRSMAISVDGTALYVVNYHSNTMSKVLTDTMEEVDEVRTADKPIGITVDPNNANVWVSNYSGVLQIFEEQFGG